MTCTDCNGSGFYYPLIGPREICLKCGGGEIHRCKDYVWQAQRWDVGLEPGCFYLDRGRGDAILLGRDVVLWNVRRVVLPAYRQEYPNHGFKVFLQNDGPDYDSAVVQCGKKDPCFEAGMLAFVTVHLPSISITLAEFFIGEDTLGSEFLKRFLELSPGLVRTKSYYDYASGKYSACF